VEGRGRPTGASEADPKPTSWWGIWFLGFYMVGLFLLLGYMIVVLWPPTLPSGTAEQQAAHREAIVLLGPLRGWAFRVFLTPGMRLLVLVMLAGALGSFLHALTSFADFVGNRQFISSWMWWYVLRPFVGAALALILYVAVRAGFLSVSAQGEAINTFGMVAIAALAGLFSKQATDKLDEVFTTMFRTEAGQGDAKRKDRLEKVPRPVATALAPAQILSGSGPVNVNVAGSDFIRGSVVLFDGQDRATAFIGATQLSASLSAEDVAAAGTYEIRVYSPGGGLSKPLALTVAQRPAAPRPILTSLEPAQVAAGSGPAVVSLLGNGFADTTVIRWGDTDRRPKEFTPTKMTVALTKEDTASPREVRVSTETPQPGGGRSDPLVFKVVQPEGMPNPPPAPAPPGGGAPEPHQEAPNPV
jgi:hypothetical protein